MSSPAIMVPIELPILAIITISRVRRKRLWKKPFTLKISFEMLLTSSTFGLRIWASINPANHPDASKGFKVDAVELVKKNLDILKSKITKETDVTAIQGNCLDLSMYDDNTFDITLILGPLYHLYTEKDAKKAKDASKVCE